MRSWGDPLRRVLVATDLSFRSRVALRRVPFLPLADAAKVLLVLVLPRGPLATAARKAQARRTLDTEVRVLEGRLRGSDRADVRVRSTVAGGDAAAEVARIARTRRVELVVTGRRGHTTLRGLVLGSTAERIARSAHVPVLIVAQSAKAAHATALVALDVAPESEPVLDFSLRVLSRSARRIVAFHATSIPLGPALVGSAERDIARLHRAEVRRARDVLTAVVAGRRRRGLDLRLEQRQGDPRWEVPKAIRRHRADLVVVGSHGRGGLAYLILGASARDVLEATDSDVLIVNVASAA